MSIVLLFRNQRTLTITSTNGHKNAIASFFIRLGQWLASILANAEQWTSAQRWAAMLKTMTTRISTSAVAQA